MKQLPLTLLAAVLLSTARADSVTGQKSAVASCGDINGDGTPDLIVASRDYQNPECVWIVSGKDGAVLRELRGKSEGEGFGQQVVGIGDFDVDGTPDVAVESSGQRLRPPTNTPPRLESEKPCRRIYSGKTGAVLIELEGQGALAPVRDLDHDGKPDLLYSSTQAQRRYFSNRLAVYVRSGATAKQIIEIKAAADTVLGQGGFGDAVAWLDDLDGDGWADIAVSSLAIARRESGEQGRWGFGIGAFSSKDGHPLWQFVDMGDGDGGPSILRALGDANGDGVSDLLVGLEDRYVLGISGKSGGRLFEVKGERHVILAYASSLDVLGDVDNDGVPDWVCGANEQWREVFDFGLAFIGSAKTGKLLLSLDDADDFGFDVSGLGDVNADGVPDVAVHAQRERNWGPGADSMPAVNVRSGKDGSLIWRKTIPELRAGAVPGTSNRPVQPPVK